jgi:predicted outer membrane protein
MRRIAVCFVILLTAASCREEKPKSKTPPFDRTKFITSTLLTSRSAIDLGQLATHRGRIPETRQFGATMHREQQALLGSLSAIAQKKGIAIPQGIEVKKAALKDNLLILPGQVFDRGYSLATLQDLNTAIANFQNASSCGDGDLEAFAKQNLPMLTAEQKSAAALLSRLGGSPFGFVP